MNLFFKKIIPVTPDVVENCLEGSGSGDGKTVREWLQLSTGKVMVTWMWVATSLREIYSLWNYFVLVIKVPLQNCFPRSPLCPLLSITCMLNYVEWKSHKK